jgi:DNA-binding NarL/FixJ family response regulator
MPPIKVMIVDDHTLVREGLMALLKLYENIVVVGEASDGKEAIDKADQLKPDVVLMDIAASPYEDPGLEPI